MQTSSDNSLISKLPDHDLLSNLEKLVRSERKITELILRHILEVETRKLHLSLGYESVYKYLTKHLGYSESAAYDRLQAARLLKSVPGVGAKLQEGKLSLTQLVKVEQSLKQEKRLGNSINIAKTEEVLNKLENKTTFESEKILAVEFNQPAKTIQKIKPQQDDSVRLELTLSQEQYELLQKAQSLISHSVRDNNLADVITYLAKSLIQKKEGKPRQEVPTQGFRVMPKSRRKYLPVNLRRKLFAKAQNSCEHIDAKTQRWCGSKYQLQIDHIRPLAKGGRDEITNLRVLCGVHNRAAALKWGLGWWWPR